MGNRFLMEGTSGGQSVGKVLSFEPRVGKVKTNLNSGEFFVIIPIFIYIFDIFPKKKKKEKH